VGRGIPTPYFPLPTYHFAHLQRDTKLRGSLLQQILIGNDDEGNVGRRNGKLNTQVGAYARRFSRGND